MGVFVRIRDLSGEIIACADYEDERNMNLIREESHGKDLYRQTL